MEDLVSSTVERLRPLTLVENSCWDYCILWKLSQNQRFIEWMGCCCGGADNNRKGGGGGGGGEEQMLPVVSAPTMATCRDTMFQHPRTRACDALAEVPSSIPLDSSSGIHAQALISNQPRWTFISNSQDPVTSDETIRTTQVLVPVPGGLVELFAAKHVPENQHSIEFVMSQCTKTNPYPYEHEEASTTFLNYITKNTGPGDDSQSWIPPTASSDHSNFPWDLSMDQSRLPSPPMNLINRPRSEAAAGFFEGSADSIMSENPPDTFDPMAEPSEMAAYGQSVMTTERNMMQPLVAESTISGDIGVHDKDSGKHDAGRRADSAGSDGSNLGEEDEETKIRVGKRPSKNLMAERKRRKKLNDRLLSLRSLVPNITKMDRASILGDAIDYVKELQRQVKDLQDELENTTLENEDEQEKQIGDGDGDVDNAAAATTNVDHMDILNQSGASHGLILQEVSKKRTTGCSSSSITKTVELPKTSFHEPKSADENEQHQMEVQVEVSQVSGNEFYVRVFCEQRAGGFVKLMEAMNSLGLEVTNANVVTFKPLVLNIFRVEKRDNEVVEAEQVRESLLELTRCSNEAWPENGQVMEGGGDGGGVDYHQQYGHHRHHQHHQQQQQLNHFSPHLHYFHHQM